MYLFAHLVCTHGDVRQQSLLCCSPYILDIMAYPDRFDDINPVLEFQAFYREIFDLELTDEQTNNIISGYYTAIFSQGEHG